MAERHRRLFGLRETLAILGLASLCYGTWLVYRPASFIVAGVVLLGAAIYGAIIENRGAARGVREHAQ
jgi:hypothetical protein